MEGDPHLIGAERIIPRIAAAGKMNQNTISHPVAKFTTTRSTVFASASTASEIDRIPRIERQLLSCGRPDA